MAPFVFPTLRGLFTIGQTKSNRKEHHALKGSKSNRVESPEKEGVSCGAAGPFSYFVQNRTFIVFKTPLRSDTMTSFI
jgi:hypothetical protein